MRRRIRSCRRPSLPARFTVSVALADRVDRASCHHGYRLREPRLVRDPRHASLADPPPFREVGLRREAIAGGHRRAELNDPLLLVSRVHLCPFRPVIVAQTTAAAVDARPTTAYP